MKNHLAFFMTAAAVMVAAELPAATYQLGVDWRADRAATPSNLWQLNIWDGLRPSVATNAEYQANLALMAPRLVRLHAKETILPPEGNGKSWVDYSAQDWNYNTVGTVYTALRSVLPKNQVEFMQNIPRWPTWMDTNGDNRLDTGVGGNGAVDMRDAYAAFCARLVKFVNKTSNGGAGYGVRYWEPINELEQFYWGNISELADIYLRCAVAMKAEDPTIMVGGPGLINPYYEFNSSTTNGFTREQDVQTLLSLIKPHCSFFSYHNYGVGGRTNSSVIYTSANKMVGRTVWARNSLNNLGYPPNTPIFNGETNIYYNGDSDSDDQMRSILGGKFIAYVFKTNTIKGNLAGVQVFNDKDGRFGAMPFGSSFNPLRSHGQVLRLYNAIAGGMAVATTTNAPAVDDGDSADRPPILDLHAIKSASRKVVFVHNLDRITSLTGPYTVFTGPTHTASLTFKDGWVPQDLTYKIHTVTESGLSTTTATWSGSPLQIDVSANALVALEFTDSEDPDRLVRASVEDTYANQSSASTNYATNYQMNIQTKSGWNREAFVKFPISDIGGSVQSATLRLYPRTISSASTVSHRLDLVPDSSWSESTVTWNNRPAATGSFLATWRPVSSTYTEIDVTSQVVAGVAAGSDFLSFRISSSGSGDDRYSTSNDVREFQPELVILRSPDQAQEIAPTDDAYVRGGSFASTNFGADGSLISKGSSSSGYRREIFMKFTLSGAGNFSSAKLVLYPTSVQASTVVDRLDEVTSDAWSEGSVTWNTKPPATGSYLASWSAVVGTELMIDITALAQAARSGDGVLSLRISSNVDRQTAYGSKENTNATVRPFLLLEP